MLSVCRISQPKIPPRMITYSTTQIPETEAIIEVYNSSGISRPTHDPERIRLMYVHANLVVTAWDDHRLVGIARALTDYCYSCYLSDLAVRKDYQNGGIGRRLIELTREQAGERSNLLLLSAAGAMGYYPKIGFEKVENAFIVKRVR